MQEGTTEIQIVSLRTRGRISDQVLPIPLQYQGQSVQRIDSTATIVVAITPLSLLIYSAGTLQFSMLLSGPSAFEYISLLDDAT